MWSAVAAAGLAGLSSLATNVFSAREADRNRRFQERMSSTAHQREVKDLRAAGINPILSARGSGSSTPSGAVAQFEDSGGKAVSSALAAQMAHKQLALMDAQIEKTEAEAQATRVGITELETTRPGRLNLQALEIEMKSYSAEQLKQTLPVLIEQARAQLNDTMSSARAANARAVLDELARSGAVNEAELQRLASELGPLGRVLMQLVNRLGPRR